MEIIEVNWTSGTGYGVAAGRKQFSRTVICAFLVESALTFQWLSVAPSCSWRQMMECFCSKECHLPLLFKYYHAQLL